MTTQTTDPAAMGRLRRLGVAVGPLLIATAIPAPLVAALRDRLPDRVYTTDAAPQYATPWPEWTIMMTAGGVFALAVVVVRFAMLWRLPGTQRTAAVIGWALAAALLCQTVLTVIGLLDVTAPPAPADPWWLMPAQFALIGLAAGAGWLIAGPAPEDTQARGRPDPVAPRLPLAADERVVWTRSMFVPAQLFVALASLALAAALWWMGGGFAMAPPLLIGVAAFYVLISRVRVVVDRGGVTVVQPLLRRVRMHVPHRHIATAHTRRVSVWGEFLGGYGLIDNNRARGYLGRSGEALSLRLADGREFLVTVDDATTAAGLVNAELDRQRSPAC